MAAGGGVGSGSGNPFWMMVWMIVLVFFSFPIAGFSAGWYIIINPFTVMIDGLQGLTDFLLKGVQFTHFSAKHMVEGTPFLEAFK